MDNAARQWRADALHLPEFMRDFHDQKSLFKAMHERIRVEGHTYAKDVSWVVGHCYIVDVFLWFMAMHGWTLQRTRKRATFDDIYETMARKDAMAKDAAILSEALSGIHKVQPTNNETRG